MENTKSRQSRAADTLSRTGRITPAGSGQPSISVGAHRTMSFRFGASTPLTGDGPTRYLDFV